MVKVSIIIPVYNSEKYLKKCLDSICNQSLQDIEIIILDDASTDHSLDIIKSFEKRDSRIKVIHMDRNVGPGVLRNIGISLSNGEYIGFIDSDDYIEPNMYEELYQKIVQNDVDIILSGFIKELFGIDYEKMLGRVDRNLDGYSMIEPKKNPNFLCDAVVGSVDKLYRHDFIEGFRFPEHLKFEDYPMIINMLGSTDRIISMNRSFYHYRIRPNSITTSDQKRFEPGTLDIFECNRLILKYYTENGLLSIFENSLNDLFLIHSVSKLLPMLSISMPYLQKKQLISYYINLLDIEFDNWQENKFYLRRKESSIRLGPYMYLIEKFFLDDNMRGETDSEKVKQKIMELCGEQK